MSTGRSTLNFFIRPASLPHVASIGMPQIHIEENSVSHGVSVEKKTSLLVKGTESYEIGVSHGRLKKNLAG